MLVPAPTRVLDQMWAPVRRRDLALPIGLAVVGAVEMLVTRPQAWPVAVLLEVLAAGCLVPRRQLPILSSCLAALLLLQMPVIGPQLDQASTPILYVATCGYVLARWRRDHLGVAGIAVILVGFFLDYMLVDTRPHGIGDVIFVLALVVPPYVFGRVTRRLADQAEELAAAHEAIRAQAAREERDRIARELHDVIAHSVSAMVVQTTAAGELLHSDPERARHALDVVAATGRKALVETGGLLRILRDSENELGLEPVPGLAHVPELVERFRSDGLRVDLELAALPELPATVDVSAYRIVQEALTNALRYAGGHTVSLRVRADGAAVHIHSSNPCAGRAGRGSGLGLLGMSERVALLGGRISHGVGASGRFELDAVLPLGLTAGA